MSDELKLTPTQELIIEVLAARYRAGDPLFTFARRFDAAAQGLADLGLILYGNAWVDNGRWHRLTDAGIAYALSDGYQSHYERERDEVVASRDALAEQVEAVRARCERHHANAAKYGLDDSDGSIPVREIERILNGGGRPQWVHDCGDCNAVWPGYSPDSMRSWHDNNHGRASSRETQEGDER